MFHTCEHALACSSRFLPCPNWAHAVSTSIQKYPVTSGGQSLDAHSLDCSSRHRFSRHQGLFATAFPNFAEPTVRTIYDRIRSLKAAPNRGRPGHRTGTRELAL